MHDEARLLRDDLGQPREVVGLWLDVSEATEAAERTRQSEERYRVLVEDSPAMICRYRPDLSLVFGNRPLADYLHCTPEQLVGANLGQWLSASQRELPAALAGADPRQPMSSAEICLQLPGRERAWWVWADHGAVRCPGPPAGDPGSRPQTTRRCGAASSNCCKGRKWPRWASWRPGWCTRSTSRST
jgi:PAS domain-containing protein